jgi:hypothetical protein
VSTGQIILLAVGGLICLCSVGFAVIILAKTPDAL